VKPPYLLITVALDIQNRCEMPNREAKSKDCIGQRLNAGEMTLAFVAVCAIFARFF
jgi:hypothetical protein